MKNHTNTFTRTFILLFILMPVISFAQSDGIQTMTERAVQSGIPQPLVETVVERAQNRQYSEQEIINLLMPAISLAESNLPSNMMVQKALEGIAKNVPPHLINNVLDNLERGIQQAAIHTDSWLEKPEVSAWVEQQSGARNPETTKAVFRNTLLESSAPLFADNGNSENFRELLEDLGRPDVLNRTDIPGINIAIRVFGDLPEHESNSGLNRKIIVKAIQSGFRANQMQQLPAAFQSAQMRANLPAEAVAHGLDNLFDAGLPAEQILRNLFQGNMGGGPPGFVIPGTGKPDNPGNQGGRGRPDRGGPPN